MSLFSNQVVPYNKLKTTLPDRYFFLNPQQVEQVDKLIESNKPLLFLPTYLQEVHLQDVKYEKALYKIVLNGVFTDGRRINVIIDGIEPYFEVRVPHPTDPLDEGLRGKNYSRAKYINELRDKLNRDELTKPEKITIIKAKPFKYYRTEQSEFIRFYYKKTKNRQFAIKFVKKEGYETTSDDLNSYYRVVCRDHLTTFSSWAVLDNYTQTTVPSLKGTTYRLNIKDYKPYLGTLTSELLKDKTLSVCWDIETWDADGNLPQPENVKSKIFSLSMTFQWVNEQEPFLKLCFCDMPAEPRPEYLTVICGSEKNIIKGFADAFAKLRPEFIFGFNDSDYDWNWVIKRAAQSKGLLSYIAERFDSTVPFQSYTDANVLKFNFKHEHIKLEATTYADGTSLMMHGYIPVDVRTVFRKLYPTAEQSSLKFFLARNKLGGKEDMPIQVLFKIYTDLKNIRDSPYATFAEDGSAIEFEFLDDTPVELIEEYNKLKKSLADVNYYCVVDSQRCHDLVKIRSVIMDKREVSNLAYTSVYDAFYRADGMKVRNLTIAKGQKAPFNIKFTNIGNFSDNGKEKYPGAFVFPPRKGLKVTKLSVAERIKKAYETKDTQHPDCQEWLSTDLESDEIKRLYHIVEAYGPVIQDKEKIKTIEEKENIKLPKHFKEFLAEDIGRPITGLDFSSLYPSLIRCYNFTPEYCILSRSYAKEVAESGQKITKVDFEYGGRRRVGYFVWHNNKLNPTKEITEVVTNIVDGKEITTEVKKVVPDPEFQFGVYPYILDDLFNKRAVLKKEMKKFAHQKEELEAKGDFSSETYTDVCFNLSYLNSKQNALKVFMNTFYGEAGNSISPFFVLEVAGGITQYGKENIQRAFKFVKERECNVYYGDSVAEYTPIFIRKDGEECYCEIKDLAMENEFHQYNDDKEIAILKNYEIWSDNGWTNIKHVIRHKTDKKMFRVLTHNSVVDVTEDHSLLDEKCNIIKPENVIGKNLLLKSHPITTSEEKLVSKGMAWTLGLFVAEGSCGTYNCKSGKKSSWGLVNQDLELLNQAKYHLETEYPDYEWKILDCMESSAVHKLVPGNKEKGKIVELVTQWRDMCYYGLSKVVPDVILGSNEKIQLEFFKGYYWGDGDKSSNNNKYDTDFDNLSKRFDIKSQLSAFSFYMLCKALGYNVSINCRPDKLDIYRLTITKRNQRKNPKTVKMIIELPETEAYVYDIETENHHFSAGVGELVVHNTDSLYLSVPESTFTNVDKLFYCGKMDKLEYWTKLVELSFDAVKNINKDVNEMFFQDNGTRFLSMAYEEILYPVAFTAKKKYFGIAHENIANFKPKELFIRGLEVKKRGVSDLLKKIFTEIMWTCMSPENLLTLRELVQNKINEIYIRKWDPKDFIQTDVWRPTKNNVKIKTFVERMKKQGITVKPNERFEYVIVKKYPYNYDYRGRKETLGVGDKIELVDIAQKQGLDIDLDHYMQSSINGQLGRLVAYHKDFHVEPLDSTPEELAVAEGKIYKNACKFVDDYCKKYYANYNTFGKTYQKIFKTANKIIGDRIKEKDSLVSNLLTANVDLGDIENWLVNLSEKEATKLCGEWGKVYVTGELRKLETKEAKEEKLKLLQKIYHGTQKNNISNTREKAYSETISILKRRIRESVQDITKLFNAYHYGINTLTSIIKNEIGFHPELFKSTSNDQAKEYKLDDFNYDINEEELDQKAIEYTEQLFKDDHVQIMLDNFKNLYNDLIAAQLFIKKTRSIVDYLKMRRNHQVRIVVRPDDEVMKSTIESDVKSSMENINDTDFKI